MQRKEELVARTWNDVTFHLLCLGTTVKVTYSKADRTSDERTIVSSMESAIRWIQALSHEYHRWNYRHPRIFHFASRTSSQVNSNIGRTRTSDQASASLYHVQRTQLWNTEKFLFMGMRSVQKSFFDRGSHIASRSWSRRAWKVNLLKTTACCERRVNLMASLRSFCVLQSTVKLDPWVDERERTSGWT